MLEAVKREISFRLQVKSVSATRKVTLGEISAAERGVPVGTQIEETIFWHRNPITQLRWRISHRNFNGRIRRPSLTI